MVYGALILLISLLAPQSESVARWTFDGDVKDSGPGALPTRAVGRIEFIDSPVSGKMAVFNGVDGFIQVDPPDKLGAGSGDMTLSFWVFPLERQAVTLFSRTSWSLKLIEDGSLNLSREGETFKLVAACPAGQWTHIAFVVRRGDRDWSYYIVRNGEVMGGPAHANNLVAPPDFDPPKTPLLMGQGPNDKKPFCGFLDDVRVLARALDEKELSKITDDGIPWVRPKNHAKTPFRGKFELLPNDVVSYVGGENARVGLDLGYLETLLSLRTPGRSVRFRNMAWEGDTVYQQPRPVNFGSWTDQFRRSGTSVIFAQFGQLESLDGKAGLPEFILAYDRLLEEFDQRTKRVVLVSPTPFGRGTPPQPDLSARNNDLKLYVDAIRELASKRGYLFVDLSTKALAEDRLTRDGLHLTAAGHWVAAREALRQLEVAGLSDLEEPNPQGAFKSEAIERLRTAIGAKNALWNNSWRPTNWSFLAGDRMEQPSSRDHLDRRVRWFPVEIQQFPAMVRREEEKIDGLIQAAEKK